MDINGTIQNIDESNFSEDQILESSDDQTSTATTSETQNINDDGNSSANSSSSNDDISEYKSNTSIVSSDISSSNTDVMLIQSPKLLKNANLTSQSSSTKDTSDNTDDVDSSAASGSFLKDLFEINGPASRSINELLKEYPYLPYYSLFSLLTASTGRESVERMLEWLRQLQERQVATTEGLIKNKEYMTEKQLLDAESEDDKTQANARAGVSPSGMQNNIDTNKCLKIFLCVFVIIVVTVASIVTAGAASAAGAGVLGVLAAAAGGFVAASTILALIGALISGIVSAASKDPSTRAKIKAYCDLLNPVNAFAEIVVMVAEIFTSDEAKLQKIRLIERLVFTVIFIALAIFSAVAAPAFIASAVSFIVAASGLISGIIQIVQAAHTLSTLEKQKEVAGERLKLETAIAYCEKLQKDLDIISSEIDILVELFTAAMDKIRAEYDRISRMIKETSDVKNMIARNIGA